MFTFLHKDTDLELKESQLPCPFQGTHIPFLYSLSSTWNRSLETASQSLRWQLAACQAGWAQRNMHCVVARAGWYFFLKKGTGMPGHHTFSSVRCVWMERAGEESSWRIDGWFSQSAYPPHIGGGGGYAPQLDSKNQRLVHSLLRKQLVKSFLICSLTNHEKSISEWRWLPVEVPSLAVILQAVFDLLNNELVMTRQLPILGSLQAKTWHHSQHLC